MANMREETKLSEMGENVVRASNEILTRDEDKCTIVRKERCPKLERQGIAHPCRILAWR
jgi:hypothetical protein